VNKHWDALDKLGGGEPDVNEALENARHASELDENTLYETVRVLAAKVRGLHARDAAAKAVVQAYWASVGAAGTDPMDQLWKALDALARAHEDGGRDR
jgi:hypothetical protein